MELTGTTAHRAFVAGFPARRRPSRLAGSTISVASASYRSLIKCRAAPEEKTDASTTSSSSRPVDAEWAQEVLTELVDSKELGQRGEAWFAAQVVALLLVAFPPEGLRGLVDAFGWAAVAGGLGLAYGGLVLAAAGLSLALGDELRMLFAALTFLVLDRKASYEEELLVERFGQQYEEYRRSGVKKLIPYIY